MKPLFIFLFMLCATGLFPYQPEEQWYPGQVKLMDGSVLTGDINYNLEYQMAKVRIDGQTTTLREKQLTSMVLFIEKFRHEFRQVALKNEQGEVSFTFAKLIYNSRKKFSLYKEYLAATAEVDIDPTTGRPTIKEPPVKLNKGAFTPDPLGTNLDYRLFLADSEGKNQPITDRGISLAYGQCYEKIRKFAVRNRLSIRKEADLVRIIRYADSVSGCSDY